MKKIGIIVEYNPLHNGHVYHFNKIKEQANADLVIAVCSSSFTMRGDLSMFDKFTKTKEALRLGIDLVIELPAVCAVQNADIFAYNAVKTLNNAKVDEIWIGSELNDFTIYKSYYEIENNTNFSTTIKDNLKQGLSYKASYNEALKLYNLPPLNANDTLGLCYYKAIKKLNSNILLKTIKRIGDAEDSNTNKTNMPSASYIRENFDKSFVPDYVYNDYQEYHFDINKLYPYFNYELRITKNTFFFDEEGLKNYLLKFVNEPDYHSFINKSHNKRYSKSRIKRFFFYTLFQITKEDIKDLNYDFLRILGFNEAGKKYLNAIKKETKIYTNIKEGLNPILDIELKITKLIDYIYKTNLLAKEQQIIKGNQ